MVQITIIGPRGDYQQILDVVWDLNCIHLVEIDNPSLDPIDVPTHTKQSNQYRLDTLTEMHHFFASHSDRLIRHDQDQIKLEMIEDKLQQLAEQVNRWKKERSSLEEKLEVYGQYDQILKTFQDIIPQLSDTGLLEVRGIIIRNPTVKIKQALHQELQRQTEGLYELSLQAVSSDLLLGSLIYPKELADKIRTLLEGINISELTLPSSIQGGNLVEKLDNLETVQNRMKIEEEALMKKLQEIYDDFLRFDNYYKFLTEEVAKIGGLPYFRQSTHFNLLSGFCDIRELDTVRSACNKLSNVQVLLDKSEIQAPTQMKNTEVIKEFQVFTDLLPPLASQSIDPTLLIAIFFPLFYGFIVGDIGYGLIIATLGYYVYQKYGREQNSTFGDLGMVFLISGISAIVFGILFGEFFGNFAVQLGIRPLWFHRGEDLMTLLLISIAIGAFHIILGISLGIYNAWKVHHTRAMYGHSGMLLVFVSIALIALQLLYASTILGYISGIIALVGLYYLLVGEGFIGIIEIISTFANMLSYARLMALGAASVILADLANEMYHIAGGGILGLVITLLVHLLNIVIAMFSPTIHSMRLHLVEFFNKFVEYGVTKYTPFGPTTQISKGGM